MTHHDVADWLLSCTGHKKSAMPGRRSSHMPNEDCVNIILIKANDIDTPQHWCYYFIALHKVGGICPLPNGRR